MTALHKWSTACPDWETRIVNRESLIPLPYLFPENADEAFSVFDNLVMVDAANSPTFGEVCRDWTREFVGHIFASYDNATGVRHITEYFMLISKKNGKSTTAAAIMLTALILNWRQEAEFIIISPTVEIANNSFKPAAAMVRADEELSELFMVQDHIRQITHRVTGATLKVVAADSNTVSGKKAVGVLVDELWLFGKDAKADAMLMEAMGGLASRPEGFVIYLTTQSDDPPAGVFKAKLEYARNVRDGKVDDPQFLPVIYEFPMAMLEAEEHKLPENFYVTNPNLTVEGHPELGGSVNVAFILREWRKAQEEGEEKERLFLAKHLNVEIGLNLRADRWPGAECWEESAWRFPINLQYILDECEVVTAGIDGGGLDDLLGLSVVGRTKREYVVQIPASVDPLTGKKVPAKVVSQRLWLAWMHAWAHPSVLRRRKDIASKLLDFAKAKQMTLVSRIGEDTAQLAGYMQQINESGLLFQIGLDPNAIGAILDAILQVDVPEDKMVGVNQGWKLAGSIKTAERKLAQGVLKHDGSALMKWCVGNAKVKASGNAIVITKQISGTAKIDPLMAMFNAVQLMALEPPAQNDALDFNKMVICG